MEKVLVDRPRPHFLIADDHVNFAEALKVLLEQTYSVIGVVADGRAMVRMGSGARCRIASVTAPAVLPENA